MPCHDYDAKIAQPLVLPITVDRTEIDALIADLERAGEMAKANNLDVIARGIQIASGQATLGDCIQGECIEMVGGDPVESIIARAVTEAACKRETVGTGHIGGLVAIEIKAYRREMADDGDAS